MIAVIAKLNVKPGCEQEFETAMLNLVSQVNENEPGNHLYKLCKQSDGNYVVMELYEDQAAFTGWCSRDYPHGSCWLACPCRTFVRHFSHLHK